VTRDEYDDYLRAFNEPDFDRLGGFFTEDAVFAHLPHLPRLEGRQAILDFYQEIKANVCEVVTPLETFFDEHGIAAEVSTRFDALRDWPGFPATPLQRGDVYRMSGVVFYFTEGARFKLIRGVVRLTASVTRVNGEHTVLVGAAA